MPLTIDSLVIFRGDTGLSLSVVSDRYANRTHELSNVVSSLESYYQSITPSNTTRIPRQPRYGAEDALWYDVLSGSDYIATVKITPKGVSTKTRRREREDYAVADTTLFKETYWINFFPRDKSKRKQHREGYARFVDPRREKTRRN